MLLVEAGGSNRKLEVRAPLAFAKQFHTKLDWDYWAGPEPNLNGRLIYEPRAKMLGGCSSMNAMIYIRGNRLDYDGWAESGATGWSYDDVLPLFRRSENNEQFADEFHGRGGPLNVTQIRDVDPICRAYVDAAAALGIPRNDDFNGAAPGRGRPAPGQPPPRDAIQLQRGVPEAGAQTVEPDGPHQCARHEGDRRAWPGGRQSSLPTPKGGASASTPGPR